MTRPAAHFGCAAEMVVADAGPLIHLDELNCLSLLADFHEVHVPETVWAEVLQHRPQAFECALVIDFQINSFQIG